MTENTDHHDSETPLGTGRSWVSIGPGGGQPSPWDMSPPVVRAAPRRRVVLPVLLFLATCCSTFVSGSIYGTIPTAARERIIAESEEAPPNPLAIFALHVQYGWREGLTYMAAVMGILLAHEMGHFLQALRYRVPASLPFFIPMPIPPIGTMGAVIAMPGFQADRKQLFDIGLTGPLAGLALAVPIAWFGIQSASFAEPNPAGGLIFQDPLLFKALIHVLHPQLPAGQELAMNPLLQAAWVGMLITGLNMLPVSQLDGGHVAYALFGRRSYFLAWGVLAAAVAFIVTTGQYGWSVMLALVICIGATHPPTADDRIALGWPRRLIGLASLAIPVLCFSPIPIRAI